MVFPGQRFYVGLKNLLFKVLNRLRVIFLRVKLLILTLHELAHIQEGAEIEIGRVFFFVEVDFMFVFYSFLSFFRLFYPMLHLFLLLYKGLLPVYLKNMCLKHSLFKKLVLQEQFFNDLVTKSESTGTVIKMLLWHHVALCFGTWARHCKAPLILLPNYLFHSEDFVLSEKTQLDWFRFLNLCCNMVQEPPFFI